MHQTGQVLILASVNQKPIALIFIRFLCWRSIQIFIWSENVVSINRVSMTVKAKLFLYYSVKWNNVAVNLTGKRTFLWYIAEIIFDMHAHLFQSDWFWLVFVILVFLTDTLTKHKQLLTDVVTHTHAPSLWSTWAGYSCRSSPSGHLHLFKDKNHKKEEEGRRAALYQFLLITARWTCSPLRQK